MQRSTNFPDYQKELDACNSIFSNIKKGIKRRPGYVVDIPLLQKAYETAKKCHGDTRRRSGSLYLRHPLSVTEELSRLMCKTSVLAAAMLHDTMEDCDLTYEAIREDFSYEIAEIVSAVTAIKAHEKEKDEHFASMTADEKHAFLDRLTDAKLITTKYQREAFLVRFADREHNLSTIDACRTDKRLLKIASTRDFLIPAARRLGMRYFETMLNEYCMRFDEEDFSRNRFARLHEARVVLNRASGLHTARFDQVLLDALDVQDIFSPPRFNPFARHRGPSRDMPEPRTVPRRLMLTSELEQQAGPTEPLDRSHLDLWEIILTCRDLDAPQALSHFVSMYRTDIRKHGYLLEYIAKEHDAVILRLTDKYENNFRIILLPESRLEAYFIGDPNGDRLTMIDEESPGDALRPQITVWSFSPAKGYKKYAKCVPYGATALDFAFIISPALAVTVKSAKIHPWKDYNTQPFTDQDHSYPLRTTLSDGDVVHFDANYFPRQPERCIHTATIDWFGDINTERAKNCLIRYFKDKYPT